MQDISREWDKAEGDIKIAEQIVEKLSLPAINELRYAGRRLIDAINTITSGSNDKLEQFCTLLDEAKLFCYRARHDSVDAVSSKIAIDLQTTIEKIGYAAILGAYPDFPALVRRSTAVQTAIGDSRKDRNNRDAIYSAIESSELESFVKEYKKFKSSEEMMLSLAKEKRSERFYGKYGFWIGTAIGLIGILIGLIK